MGYFACTLFIMEVETAPEVVEREVYESAEKYRVFGFSGSLKDKDEAALWWKCRKRFEGIGCQCVEYEVPHKTKIGVTLGAVWWFFENPGIIFPVHVLARDGDEEISAVNWGRTRTVGKDATRALVWMTKEHWGFCRQHVKPQVAEARKGARRYHAPWPGDCRWP